MNIDKELIQWLDAQRDKGEFESRSAGIRRCIRIAQRLYEKGSNDDIAKYVHGR